MNRIDQTFLNLRNARQKAFISYTCGCDPNFQTSLDILIALADSGVDVLEIGIPFSDPLADGTVNQQAAQRALDSGASTRQLLDLVREFRKSRETPIVLFTYLNPIYSYGFTQFQRDALAAGADGILILDLPPDESAHPANHEFSTADGLASIRLIAPSTPSHRFSSILSNAQGFIYALSRAGVTGMHAAPSALISSQVARIRQHTDIPVCIGFGISTPEQAAEVAHLADGVIVGSAIVSQIAQFQHEADLPAKIANFVKPLIAATKLDSDADSE